MANAVPGSHQRHLAHARRGGELDRAHGRPPPEAVVNDHGVADASERAGPRGDRLRARSGEAARPLLDGADRGYHGVVVAQGPKAAPALARCHAIRVPSTPGRTRPGATSRRGAEPPRRAAKTTAEFVRGIPDGDFASGLGERERALEAGRPGTDDRDRTTSRAPGRTASGAAGLESRPGGASCGLTVHSRVGSNARQSSLQATHGRTVCGRPANSLRGRSGSAISPRARPTMSAPRAERLLHLRLAPEAVRDQQRPRRQTAQARRVAQQRRRLGGHVAHIGAAHADGQVQVVDRRLDQRATARRCARGQAGVGRVTDRQPDAGQRAGIELAQRAQDREHRRCAPGDARPRGFVRGERNCASR